jgi:excisionase family DNA binding protein
LSGLNNVATGKSIGVLAQDPLLCATDVAELLGVKTTTVYEWARMGYIPSIRLGTGKLKPCVRFERHAIEQWLNAKRKAGRASRIPKDN